MARDLVPRTIELTRTQLTALTAVGHIERRSISFLVREAVEGYIAAYNEAKAAAVPSDPLRDDAARYVGQPNLKIDPARLPEEKS